MISEDQLKILKTNFRLCTFKFDGECSGHDCKTALGGRVWFESTSYEYPHEGNYYCDNCGIMRISQTEDEILRYAGMAEEYEKEVGGE